MVLVWPGSRRIEDEVLANGVEVGLEALVVDAEVDRPNAGGCASGSA